MTAAPGELLAGLQAVLGVPGAALRWRVGPAAVAAFADSVATPPRTDGLRLVPPTFLCAIPYARPPVPPAPPMLVLNLANGAQIERRLQVGEAVTSRAAIGRVRRRGSFVIAVVEIEYRGDDGRLAATGFAELAFTGSDEAPAGPPAADWWPVPAPASEAVLAGALRPSAGPPPAPGGAPCLTVGPVDAGALELFAAATGDHNPIHQDADAAAARGLPGVMVPGLYRMAVLARCVEEWAGERGRLRSLTARYRGMDLRGAVLSCRGSVRDETAAAGTRTSMVELSMGSSTMEATTTGTAVIEWA